MNNDEQREMIEFALRCAHEFPKASVSIRNTSRNIHDLITLAKRHQRLAVEDCNRELSTRERRNLDTIRNVGLPRVMARVAYDRDDLELGRSLIDTSGDPRGYTVKVLFPSGASNNFGGEGWGVPNA